MSVFERQTLGNGLRVLTAPLPHAQSVACFVMLAAGSRYERAENRGIAHFAEHMFFKGTERRPNSRDLTTLIDGIGGEFNAFTSKEYTGYFVRCAGEKRDVALDVLLDMLRHSKFDPEEIEREKGVIIEEMNMYQDTPRDHIGTVYETLMYGDNPLGWEIIGTKDTVNGADRDTFMEYVDEWYTADRMVVGVGGMVGDDLTPMLEDLLGDLPAAHERGPAPAQLDRTPGPRVAVHHKDAEQAHLILGYPSYPIDHPDRYALQMLSAVLGSGMSSRLFLEVRERRGLAYYVHGANHSYSDAGSLYAQAGVDIKRIDEAIKVTVEQFERMASEEVGAEELEKSRSMVKGRFVLRTEGPQGLIMYGLTREVLEGQALEPEDLLKEIDAVTAEDIQRVARDLIANDKLHLAVIGPFEGEHDRFLETVS
ncbi:MAG TPA: pitrilysin family protein [Gaiellaceae bacterium]|nr:pitrilysin family protein [Gaiellaceae bacterium]